VTFVMLCALAACGERELILDGERLDVRAPLPGSDAAASEPAIQAAPAFVAPAPQNYTSWSASILAKATPARPG